MTGIGPLEPGEGTWAREPAEARPAPRPWRRRTLLIPATACAVLAAGAALWITRPRPAPPPELPFPAQTVTVAFLAGRTTAPHRLAFDVRLAVEPGPPVTVTRVSQPYAGISAESEPRAPFRTAAGSARVITVTMRVTECGKVPKNAALPFLEVTLRNTRAIQTQSFILGPRYTRYLSRALGEACGESTPSSPKPPRRLNS
ncbi:Tat pathway signal sequence domain protein [Streptomyces sp. SID1328]|uniref:Tat pathway signal sequence domain protein n=1 Tax=Streptomyces sp. SID1328 TaxID=2690250 RepID=UPI00136BB102|nr:Tat pathway signal sequence domain protein [Streptomyces sp. SID1328]MYV41777.1 Tat pathway signal sequence domain protein [Streptomyces sp. SID1328]